MPAKDYASTRFSGLEDINTSNVTNRAASVFVHDVRDVSRDQRHTGRFEYRTKPDARRQPADDRSGFDDVHARTFARVDQRFAAV